MSRLLLIPVGAASALALSILGFGCGGVGAGDGLFDSGSAGAGGAPMSTSVTTGSPTETTSTTGATTATTSTSATTTSVSVSASSASSSTGGVVEMLACGDTTCPLGEQNACCWSKFGMPMASGACVKGPIDSDGCKTYVAQDGLQSRLECQTSAQCAQGTTCCGHRTYFNQQNFFYDLVSCVDSCPSTDVKVCDPANAADVCPKVTIQGNDVQTVCKQSGSLPPGYFVCSLPG
jgi:hypothetical protein